MHQQGHILARWVCGHDPEQLAAVQLAGREVGAPAHPAGLDDDLADPIGVVDADVEHEAVELSFGQGIGALLFNRVLRRQDKKWQIECIGPATRRDLVFLHRL